MRIYCFTPKTSKSPKLYFFERPDLVEGKPAFDVRRMIAGEPRDVPYEESENVTNVFAFSEYGALSCEAMLLFADISHLDTPYNSWKRMPEPLDQNLVDVDEEGYWSVNEEISRESHQSMITRDIEVTEWQAARENSIRAQKAQRKKNKIKALLKLLYVLGLISILAYAGYNL